MGLVHEMDPYSPPYLESTSDILIEHLSSSLRNLSAKLKGKSFHGYEKKTNTLFFEKYMRSFVL
jgi:hypothetical protein